MAKIAFVGVQLFIAGHTRVLCAFAGLLYCCGIIRVAVLTSAGCFIGARHSTLLLHGVAALNAVIAALFGVLVAPFVVLARLSFI